jgi:chromosome segregation ATPase
VAAQKRLQDGLNKNRARLQAVEAEKRAVAGEKEKLVASQRRLQNDLGRSTRKLQSLQKGQDAAQAEKDRLAGERRALEAELGSTKAQLKALEKGKADATAEKGELLAAQKGLEKKLGQSLAKLDALERGQAKAAAEKAKLLAGQEALEKELADSRGKLKQLEQGQAAASAEKAQLAADRQKLEEELAGSRELLKSLEKSKDATEAEKAELLIAQQKLARQIEQQESELDALQKSQEAAAAEKARLLASRQKMQRKLGDYQAREKLRENIIASLKDNFDRHGITADINEATGEVTLPFDQTYFDFDSAVLKPEMQAYLQQIVPVYSDSLFGEDNIYKYIKSIEVIGYASPIYKGKFVDPGSLDREAREALNYNMDLSYRRARSIFKYILDQSNMSFGSQKDLLLYLKVTGRSYLESAPTGYKEIDEMGMEEFCRQYDCEKLQRAVVRFNLVE